MNEIEFRDYLDKIFKRHTRQKIYSFLLGMYCGFSITYTIMWLYEH